MRDLSMQEIDNVSGGPGPLIFIVGALIGAAGAAIGGYLAGRDSNSSNSGNAANGASVSCPEGTAPKANATEASCVKI